MKIIIILLTMLTGITNLSAQTPAENINTVTGYVIDEAGIPIPSVNIRIKNAAFPGIKTDKNGKFSIAAEKGNTLEFFYLGMISQEIKVCLSSEYFIIMKEAKQFNLLVSDCNTYEKRRGISVASYYMFGY